MASGRNVAFVTALTFSTHRPSCLQISSAFSQGNLTNEDMFTEGSILKKSHKWNQGIVMAESQPLPAA